MLGKATTGLTGKQLDELVGRVGQRIVWDRGVGRPRVLSLRQAVNVALTYYRRNITEEVIGELLLVDQSVISDAINLLEPIISEVLEEFVPDAHEEAEGRVTVVDGSLCPCWSWADTPALYSGKHHTTGHNHQFVSDLDGRLIYISDPLTGNTHDAKAVTDTGLRDIIDLPNTIADKGYIGTGAITPIRKPVHRDLLQWEKEFNTAINEIRYVIERAIANFKTWRCMHTDYRRPLHTYPAAFRTIRSLYFFQQRFT